MSDDERRALEWAMSRLAAAREERDRYRGWFDRLFAAALRGDDELHAELERLREAYDHIVNARTRKRTAVAADKRVLAIEKYQAHELVKNIAKDLGRSQRWVYDVVPKDLKRRRKFT